MVGVEQRVEEKEGENGGGRDSNISVICMFNPRIYNY